MHTLIKNGQLVLEDSVYQGDLLIENDTIKSISERIDIPSDKIIDASGCYVFPGFIDTHTHFDLDLATTSTADTFLTGTKAALVGGTTSVLDFATQDKGMTMMDAYRKWMKKAKNSSCHFGFHMAVSEWNQDRINEIEKMIELGITSFKMYMVYEAMKVNDGEIYDAVKRLKDKNCIIGVHCENDDIIKMRVKELLSSGKTQPEYHAESRPNLVEADGVARLMDICALAEAPAWVVHLSTAEGLFEAEKARARGQEVYLECCPQYIALDKNCYKSTDGAKFVMSPPLRTHKDNEALLSAMRERKIDWIGTDHCSFTMAQKAVGKDDFSKIPNGGAGVQNRAEIVYEKAVKGGYISILEMGKLLSENAAKLFGMFPQKGVLREGSDADIVIFDPNNPHIISVETNLHNCDNSPFEGFHCSGSARHVFLSGVLAVKDGVLIREGMGKYIKRRPCLRYRK